MKYRMVSLGNLIEKTENVRCGDHQYPVLSMTMHEGLVFQDNKFKKIIASKDKSDYKVVYRNQLVIGFPIDEGVLAAQRVTDIGIVSPAYTIWSINQGQIIPEFLEYALRCEKSIHYYKAKLRGSTARRRSLPTPTLLEHTIPVPDKAEQERILNIIHNVKNVIAYRKEEIKALDNLIKARFVEMFGDPILNEKEWSCVMITDVCQLILGGGTPSKKCEEFFKGKIPWVTPKDMKQSIINDSIDHITEDAIVHSTTNLIPIWSVLMVIRSGILKHALPVAINSIPVTINQDMKAFIPGENITAEFLMYFFKAIEEDVLSKVRGVTADNIDFKTFQKREIIVPPMELQNQFAAFVTQVDKSKVVA